MTPNIKMKMDDTLVSIIVPVYKTPVILLKRFLQSALNQTILNIQLIAVNDASPDDCPKVLDTEAAKDSRMVVFHRTTNGRAGTARNDGMKLVKGKYVLFADADDKMQPDMCETLVNHALKTDADIVACSWSVIDQNGHYITRKTLPRRYYNLNLNRQRAKAYRRLNYALWNKLFKFKIISSLKFEPFEANIGEDILFNVAALCKSRSLLTTPYCGYNYTITETSATGKMSKGMPYLRTIALSSEKIRQTLEKDDKSMVGNKFSELITLKRFATGCGWIAEHTDPEEQSILWDFWKQHFNDHISPEIVYLRLLESCYRTITANVGPAAAYRLIWYANKLLTPLV